MEANELMIGNWFIPTSVVNMEQTPTQLTLMMMAQLCHLPNGEAVNFKPIPLTEEWLIKFGFKKHHSDYYNDVLMLKIIASQPNEYLIKIFPYELGSAITGRTQRLYFVHQLQNLYHALTGEELQ